MELLVFISDSWQKKTHAMSSFIRRSKILQYLYHADVDVVIICRISIMETVCIIYKQNFIICFHVCYLWTVDIIFQKVSNLYLNLYLKKDLLLA